MTAVPDLTAWGAHRYVSLTTFRRTGEPVSTPVWIAVQGDALVVTTGADSGKVKRLRRDPRVELRPCDARGQVADDADVASGTAVVVDDPAQVVTLRTALTRKYGVLHRLILGIAPLRHPKAGPGCVLRITLDG